MYMYMYMQVQNLERQLKLDRNLEVFELQIRCDQLTGTIKALESQLQHQLSEGTGPNSEVESTQLYHQHKLEEVLAHNRETQDQLLHCQKENVRLRFEYEQAVVELPRLQVGWN